jgi:hypothetical protein
MPHGSSSTNWLLAMIGLSVLIVGFGFSLRVAGSPVEMREDSKN